MNMKDMFHWMLQKRMCKALFSVILISIRTSTDVSGDPTIIPISMHRVVDVDGLQIPEGLLMGHALMNSIENDNSNQDDNTEGYAYRRGSHYVNNYARMQVDGTPFEEDPKNPNHLLDSFPILFPYRRGGFETSQPVKVTYKRHIKWALNYHDKQ